MLASQPCGELALSGTTAGATRQTSMDVDQAGRGLDKVQHSLLMLSACKIQSNSGVLGMMLTSGQVDGNGVEARFAEAR